MMVHDVVQSKVVGTLFADGLCGNIFIYSSFMTELGYSQTIKSCMQDFLEVGMKSIKSNSKPRDLFSGCFTVDIILNI